MALPEAAGDLDSVTIDYTAWPTGDDVVGQLIGGNYWPTDAAQRQQNYVAATAAAASAKTEFEKRTGWIPFLAGGSDTTWRFNSPSPNGYLDLNGGFLTVTSVSVNGTAYTENQQFYTEPANAVNLGEPITQLYFPYAGHNLYALPNTVSIVGRRGRVSVLPPDVWFAVLRYAMVMTLTSGNQDQDVTEWSKNGFSEGLDTVGVIDPKTVLNYLPKEFESAVARWKRVIC